MTTPTDHTFRDPLSAKFASLLQSSARTEWGWGFFLIRTAPLEKDESLDALLWHTAMSRLLQGGWGPPAPRSVDYDVLPDLISLPVMSDPSLIGISPCDLRERYLTWVEDFQRAYSTLDEFGNTIDGFEALGVTEEIKWNHCFLVMDSDSLKSLMMPPFGYHPSRIGHTTRNSEPRGRKRSRKYDCPWVIAVDTTLPFEPETSSSNMPYNYNGDNAPYPGWMRCSASALEQLWNDIDMLDSFEEQIYPGRTYAGEVPLYTGALPGRGCSLGLRRTKEEEYDDDGRGRYKFPVLPGRGICSKEQVEHLVLGHRIMARVRVCVKN